MSIRILLADDQRLMLDGLAALLQEYEDLEIVGLAMNGKEVIEQAAEMQPDVILLDIRMPVMDGIQALAGLRVRHPDCKVLMLTTFDNDQYIVDALRQGAVGYLLKDLPAAELAEAIRAAYRGIYSFDPLSGQRLAYLLVNQPNAVPSTAEFDRLSKREQDVLLLVARGHSNREIASQLTISEGTVKNHLSNILAALNLDSRAQIIIYAYEHRLV